MCVVYDMQYVCDVCVILMYMYEILHWIPEVERTLLVRCWNEKVRKIIEVVAENCVPSPDSFMVIVCLCGPIVFFSCIIC